MYHTFEEAFKSGPCHELQTAENRQSLLECSPPLLQGGQLVDYAGTLPLKVVLRCIGPADKFMAMTDNVILFSPEHLFITNMYIVAIGPSLCNEAQRRLVPTRQPIPEHVLVGTPPLADPTWRDLYDSPTSMEPFRINLSDPHLDRDELVPFFEVQNRICKGLSNHTQMEMLKERFFEYEKINSVSYSAFMC